MRRFSLIHGDCVEVMRQMPADSVDAIVTDPPYGLGFLGKKWDALPPGLPWAEECLRVLKPGGHIVAFGGQRTIHRLTCALEDAGFEIRDLVGWQFWSGFPKSLNVSKAIDAAAGAEREDTGIVTSITGARLSPGVEKFGGGDGIPANVNTATAPATDDAKRWNGWGTALKPCIEPATLARKPLSEGTVAANVLRWGTGALNIDGCRYAYGDEAWPGPCDGPEAINAKHAGMDLDTYRAPARNTPLAPDRLTGASAHDLGRWPANVYACPKASRSEREAGVGHLAADGERFTSHPTVKPVALMRWLCRLVTPPGGTVLDTFTGSGSTGIAALAEGFAFVGVEREAEYIEIARARIRGDAPLLNQETA